jgi:hypothetical protein
MHARTPLLFLVLAVGCGASSTPGSDGGTDGGPPPDTGLPIDCLVAQHAVGEPCDPATFPTHCANHYDYWMGRCGSERWTCEEGVIAYSDATFACALDGGVDGGPRTDCPEYEPPPAATTIDCRGDVECGPSGGTCWVPGDTAWFYVGGACPRDCTTDAECAEGSVCRGLNGGFDCGICVPACTSESCSLWESCGDDGHCRPQRCDEGYTCPPAADCVPGGVDDVDAHGCTLVPCATDGDCGCGACVGGFCALGPGRCEPPRP